MRRTVMAVVMATSFAALVGCSSSTSNTDAGNTPDSGSGNDAGGGDAGPTGGTIVTNSSGNALPTPWPGQVADFASDNSGTAKNWLNQLVQLSTSTTIVLGGSGQCGAAGFPSCSLCPAAFVSTSTSTNKSYCDGLSASANGVAGPFVYGDSFAYTSSTSACSTQLTTGTLASIRGVWNDHYNAATVLSDGGTGKTDTYSIALTQCSDIGVGTPYAGTGTAAAGTVGSTLASNPTNGSTVTVRGVVVAAWSASGGSSFGFALEDIAGGPNAGIAVGKAKTSASTAAPVNVGDDVTVTGTISTSFGAKIDL
jgi:hypothetical protein